MVKVSVVMPVYNGAKYLEKSLKSVSNQTLKDLEVICVDDGSTDNSLEVLKGLESEYTFIRIIEQENQGSGKARNTGMLHAKGEYIAFLDADDIYIDENALEEMYDVASKNDANIVSANLSFVKKDYTLKKNPHYGRGDYIYFDEKSQINPDDYGIPYAFYKNIFKKTFLKSNEIVFPDLLRGQDPVFLAKAFANTDVIYTCPVELYGYNHSVGGGVNNKMNNYIKKKSYVQHFRDTCDVLSDANLLKTCETYKLHLTRYLNWKKNSEDEDLINIYGEIFPDRYEYFSGDDENFKVFNAAAEPYLLYASDSEENFKKVRQNLKKIASDNLSKGIIERYSIVMDSDSLSQFKDKFYDYKIEKLEKRHTYLTRKIDELSGENKELEEKLADMDENIKTVKSSAGFRIAKKVKNILK